MSGDTIFGETSGLEVTFDPFGFSAIDITDVLLTTPAGASTSTSIFAGPTSSGVEFGPASLFAGTNSIDIEFGTTGAGNVSLTSTLATVPLPAAAWLMIGGLGAVGAYARRSRKTAPTA